MFRTGCAAVRVFIQMAYIQYADGQALPVPQLKNQPLQGSPDWIDSDSYTIDARPDTPQPRAMMAGPMLQRLLEERFQLKLHRERKKISAYALAVAKDGSKLQPTPTGGCTPRDPQGPPPAVEPGHALPCGYMGGDLNELHAVGVPISTLCQVVSSQVRHVVIDQTGLTGLFDFHLGFDAPPPGADPGAEGIALAVSALRQLGLELKPTTGEAEYLVIDHVERPSAN